MTGPEILADVLPEEPWKPLTLREVRDYPGLVVCVCGRKEWPSGMYFVGGLPPEVRAWACRVPGPIPDFLCSPCLHGLMLREKLDHITLLEAQGAPLELLGRLAAKRKYVPSSYGMPKALSPAVAAEMARVELEVAQDIALQEDVVRFPVIPVVPA